ncbi:MAG: isoprenyl transferase [Candidatus Omnitrophica bacterium]|nr:isoprenyl transferase [Candidatus Omnitrophota bacterium]MCF7894800.1 isoprenyl transferase [Candidatus Omnitrophota bacterium]
MGLMIPYHVAIIMDGNGRWAKEKGLSRTEGHKQGAQRVKEVAREAKKKGVKVLTLFAFSTENWNRPKSEIKYLFSYLKKFLTNYKEELIKEGIKLKIIGRRDKLGKKILNKINEVEEATSGNADFFLNIAIDYGGRWDIVNAAKAVIKAVNNNSLKEEKIDEKIFNNYLSLSEFSDPDILVRTSGEKRISNFLVWQTAYTEFYFPKVLWPDFTKEWVDNIIEEYSGRVRKFGQINA